MIWDPMREPLEENVHIPAVEFILALDDPALQDVMTCQ